MTRSRNARGEGVRLREEIVASATALLEEHGNPEAITLRAVARGAGVTAPSLYAHFADREAIVEAVMADAFAQLSAVLHDATRSIDDPRDRLRAGCLAYLRFAREHPARYTVLFSRSLVPAGTPATRRAFRAMTGADTFEVLESAIAACVAAGHSSSADPFADAAALWAGLHGYTTLRTSNPEFPWPKGDALADALIERLARLT